MISYKPLFHLLIERDITKTQLRLAIGISPATLAKISKNEPISLLVIEKICEYLQCDIKDVVEIEL